MKETIPGIFLIYEKQGALHGLSRPIVVLSLKDAYERLRDKNSGEFVLVMQYGSIKLLPSYTLKPPLNINFDNFVEQLKLEKQMFDLELSAFQEGCLL